MPEDPRDLLGKMEALQKSCKRALAALQGLRTEVEALTWPDGIEPWFEVLSETDPLAVDDLLKDAPRLVRSDREFVLAAVAQNGWALRHATEELCEDREIVLAAVGQDGYAFKYAAANLRADRAIALAAVSNYGCALYDAADELRADREIVLAAVLQNGFALKYAHMEKDREITWQQ